MAKVTAFEAKTRFGELLNREVTALWPHEVANALTVLVRRKKLTESERQTALGWLRAIPLRVDHDVSLLSVLWE